MRKLFAVFFVIVVLLLELTGCASENVLPNFTEETIYEEKTYEDTDSIIATYTACYPIFTDLKYKALNEAITDNEITQWQAIYEEIIVQANSDIAKDDDFLTFNRYINVTYSVSQNNDDLSVTFFVEWIKTASNFEPKYTRTYTLSNGMVYATTTTTKRVY